MKFKDLSLSLKLYISILVLIIIPLIIVGIYLNHQFSQFALNKASENALQTLKQTENSFDSLVTDTNDISVRILSNELVQEYTKGKMGDQAEYEKMYWNISDWVDNVVGSKNYFDSISLYSLNHVIFHRGRQAQDLDQKIFGRANRLKGRGYWETSSGKISYYRAIMDMQSLGRMLGIERFDIREESLYQFYKKMNSYSGSQIFLIDSSGRVLSSTERNRMGENLDHIDYVRKTLHLKNGYFTARIQGERSIVLFYTIEATNWTLIQSIPEHSFTSVKTTINTILFIVILLCIFFGILFSFVQHKYMVKPLRNLQKEMEKLKTGNFDISLNIDSKDEMGEVSNGFVRMAKQLNNTINDVYLTKIKQREAELKALESQINPHFLYNTLDSIHWLAIKHKNYDVSEQIEALADIFKHVLNKGEPFVTLRQEVDFLENYMFIQKQKYGKRLQLHIDIPPEILDYKMPKLVLQPLVENAIIHGLEQVIEGGLIEININRVDKGLKFIVSDNGVGVDEDEIKQMMSNIKEAKHVFALKNIDDRIKINYGQEYGLSFTSKSGVGTRVEVLIPLVE
ncbi:sensor histidine kinase [Neobacillus drentensis]|uniref:cache domain-containing sensor histidine kinase n=1 Tax=Neobacillus drentensis TaxID=220684 RepID=UPI001F221F91|nr:sensor histidine kinase [Neobacillus drentensis]ULT54892.1 sensor histidine kinase [Neobacillus drentensis]